MPTRSITDMPLLPRLHEGRVRVLDGARRGESRLVGATALVVGSGAGSDLVLPDSRVSTRHCELSLAPRGFTVRDLGSRNGTWFEGSRVQEAALPPGAIVRMGRTHLLLVAASNWGAATELSEREGFGALVGASAAMRRVYALLELAAQSDATVLLTGETGTGKDVAARAIHEHSDRHGGPFEIFDCGAAHPELMRTALMGYVDGAYTGAGRGRAGLVERASGGTLFIDEVGELPLELQPVLLRLCETRTVQRIGANAPVKVDVRLIAATNRDLAEEVARGRFRQDLYYRLQVLTIEMPPLRHRREDLAQLCRTLMAQLGASDPGAIEGPGLLALAEHDWPGNVRELQNVLQQAMFQAGGRGVTRFADFEIRIERGAQSAEAPFSASSFQARKREVVERFERDFLNELLSASQGNIRHASRISGIERTRLKRLMRRHKLL